MDLAEQAARYVPNPHLWPQLRAISEPEPSGCRKGSCLGPQMAQPLLCWFAALSGPLVRWLGLQGCGALPGAQHACFLLHKLLQHLQLPISQSPTQRGPLINQLSCR